MGSKEKGKNSIFYSALVIDSDETVREQLQSILTDKNIEVFSVSTANEAIEIFVSSKPDLVFISDKQEGMTGVELLKSFKRDYPDAYLFFLTTQDDQEVAVEAFYAGASGFFKKPIVSEQVESVLLRYVAELNREKNREFKADDIYLMSSDINIPTSKSALIPAVATVVKIAKPYCSQRDLKRLELAINEIIRNAYEHGNLGITFEQKREFLDQGVLESKMRELEESAKEEGLTINVRASIENGVFSCSVEDLGKGFDWRSKQKQKPDLLSLHGRGLILIKSVFDTVEYNETGNRITVTRKLK